MTSENILLELAVLNSWQVQFPTDDEDVQIAQNRWRAFLERQLRGNAKKNGSQP